jgi:hypothetical protein
MGEDGELEYQIKEILYAKGTRPRKALVLWEGWKDPTWVPIENLEETEALDVWEAKWGSIRANDGPNPRTKSKRAPKRSSDEEGGLLRAGALHGPWATLHGLTERLTETRDGEGSEHTKALRALL